MKYLDTIIHELDDIMKGDHKIIHVYNCHESSYYNGIIIKCNDENKAIIMLDDDDVIYNVYVLDNDDIYLDYFKKKTLKGLKLLRKD